VDSRIAAVEVEVEVELPVAAAQARLPLLDLLQHLVPSRTSTSLSPQRHNIDIVPYLDLGPFTTLRPVLYHPYTSSHAFYCSHLLPFHVVLESKSSESLL
jgi:hypothetical protein